MNIGDRLLLRPSIFTKDDGNQDKRLPCRVVYIHPERRFYTVEFRSEVTGDTFRESYLFLRERSEEPRREAASHRQLAPGRLKPGGIYDTKG